MLALSKGPQTTWTGLAAIVRFNRNNTIDVSDGGTYRADAVVPYLPNETYDITMHVNMPVDGAPGRYSVFVSSPNQPSTRIAHDYRFRTEQQYVTSIDNWVLEAEVGGISADFVERDVL